MITRCQMRPAASNSDCPIKTTIENPKFSLTATKRPPGQLAPLHQIPKQKPKKGEPSQDRNKEKSQNIFSFAKIQRKYFLCKRPKRRPKDGATS
ncbi:hypothetical protein TNIN_193561 [Trichonephila inaurata madagascariensis]|uniref:Uncharacterized protein n=1 Tax=Trichonephila inaurata madagascariensis TaxID=2747483 RepID=A0A8X6XK46_9ARAC|nr:hypothetical protein TNIN_193561 [Trichonephila inaurata madagascariensis]